MTIAIAGATGLTGSFALQLLLNHPKVTTVVSIGRRSVNFSHPKLKEVFLNNQEWPELEKANGFICCLGTTIKKAGSKTAFEAVDLSLPVNLAKALHAKGCPTMAVVSSMGASANSPVFYSRTKGKMEAAISEIGFKSVSILRPSFIEGERSETRMAEQIALPVFKFLSPLFRGPLRHYGSIHARTIAEGLIKAVTEPRPGVHIYLSNDIKLLAQQ